MVMAQRGLLLIITGKTDVQTHWRLPNVRRHRYRRRSRAGRGGQLGKALQKVYPSRVLADGVGFSRRTSENGWWAEGRARVRRKREKGKSERGFVMQVK